MVTINPENKSPCSPFIHSESGISTTQPERNSSIYPQAHGCIVPQFGASSGSSYALLGLNKQPNIHMQPLMRREMATRFTMSLASHPYLFYATSPNPIVDASKEARSCHSRESIGTVINTGTGMQLRLYDVVAFPRPGSK